MALQILIYSLAFRILLSTMNETLFPFCWVLCQLKRPDLAKIASPVTYVDKNDPPFLIVQGEKDESVPYTQSVVLQSWLQLAGVPNEIIIVPGAPHYGTMFDADNIRAKIFYFLRTYLR